MRRPLGCFWIEAEAWGFDGVLQGHVVGEQVEQGQGDVGGRVARRADGEPGRAVAQAEDGGERGDDPATGADRDARKTVAGVGADAIDHQPGAEGRAVDGVEHRQPVALLIDDHQLVAVGLVGIVRGTGGWASRVFRRCREVHLRKAALQEPRLEGAVFGREQRIERRVESERIGAITPDVVVGQGQHTGDQCEGARRGAPVAERGEIAVFEDAKAEGDVGAAGVGRRRAEEVLPPEAEGRGGIPAHGVGGHVLDGQRAAGVAYGGGEVLGELAGLEPGDAIGRGDATQRGGQLGLPPGLPDARQVAVGGVAFAARGKVGQPIGIDRHLAIKERIHREAILGGGNGGGEIGGPGARAEPLGGGLHPHDGPRHADPLPGGLGDGAQRDGPAGGMVEFGVEIVGLSGRGLPVEHGEAAREGGHLRFDDLLEGHRSQHRIDRVAACAQHIERGLGHGGVRGGDHRAIGDGDGLGALLRRGQGGKLGHWVPPKDGLAAKTPRSPRTTKDLGTI